MCPLRIAETPWAVGMAIPSLSDKTNFTDTNWVSAEGRISFHSDALHIVERYRRVDADRLEIEATVEDSKVLTGPWNVPKQTLQLAPFDQIMELACSGLET